MKYANIMKIHSLLLQLLCSEANMHIVQCFNVNR